MNLMVILVPFLLITAVFSRLTIVELNLPSAAGGPANANENFTPEVIVREAGIEITNGSAVIAAIPNRDDGEFDLEQLKQITISSLRRTGKTIFSPSRTRQLTSLHGGIRYCMTEWFPFQPKPRSGRSLPWLMMQLPQSRKKKVVIGNLSCTHL